MSKEEYSLVSEDMNEKIEKYFKSILKIMKTKPLNTVDKKIKWDYDQDKLLKII